MNISTNYTLPKLHVGAGHRYGNLTWFPVWTDAPAATRSYVTNTTKWVTVEEEPTPRVSRLRIQNHAPRPIVLFEGSLLEGGWQHRSLTQTTVVPAHVGMQIPVVCVEQGRWGGDSGQQRFGTRVVPARVRSAIRGVNRDSQGRVTQSSAEQDRVWRSVSSYASRYNSFSRTESMVDIASSLERPAESLGEPQALVGQRGVIIAAKGQPIAIELFDHPATMRERLLPLLQAYQLDVADLSYVETPSRRARRFADRLSQTTMTRTEMDEESDRFRSEANEYLAAELVTLRGDLLHVSAINARHELTLAA